MVFKKTVSYLSIITTKFVENIHAIIFVKSMKKFLHFVTYLSLFIAFVSTTYAQVKIKGTVVSTQTKQPVPFVPIAIKGTTNGVLTDENGKFEIVSKNPLPIILLFQYVGYQSKEVEVYEEGEDVTVSIREANNSLEEVVVIGYGTQKRKDITGSIASIPTELKTQPVSSPERLLQGAIAGVQVTQTSGQPGGGVSVQIRGTNSAIGTSNPLYVIDGFPINNDYSINDAGVADGPKQNPLSFLNPSDIESIDVLKDASATAIYGSRGANGVIIITTKKGNSNKSSIQYDGFYGVQDVIRTIPLLNGREWWQLRKDAAKNTPNGKTATLPAAGAFKYDTTGAGTDWQQAAFRQALTQSHSLSILSGSDKTKLGFSGNYYKQDGVLQNTGFTRYSGRINIEHDFNSKFKITSFVTASQMTSEIAPAAIVTTLLFTPPSIPIYDTLGNFLRNTPLEGQLQNPINSLYNQLNESRTTRLLANVSGEYKLWEGLSLKVLLGTDLVFNKQNRYLPNSTYEGNQSGGVGTGGTANVGSINTNSWLNENTLSYSKIVNQKHNINAVIGFTAQTSKTKGLGVSSSIFSSDDLTYNGLQNALGTTLPNSSASAWQLASFLGRLNYSYNEKYLLTVSLRADGSSRFSKDHKWGYFPSAAIGWNLHEESFLKGINQISFLKLRLSAGSTGNQDIPSYTSISRIAAFRYNFSNINVQGYAPVTVNNPKLKWEQTFQTDLGIDLGLFKNRININVDYYYKKTTDLLLNAPVPGSSSLGNYDPLLNPSQASNITQNVGAVQNKGIELAVNTQNFVGSKFSWNTILVFSKNTNEILSLGDVGPGNRIIPNISEPSVLQVGAPIGSFYVYQTDGLIQPTDAPSSLTPQANKFVGGQKYKDINGDGIITQAKDRVLIQNQPGLNFGLTNTLNYKTPLGSLDLTVFFQSSQGGKLYNNNRATLELGTGYFNATRDVLNHYSASNTNTDIKAPYQDPAVTISDRFIEDASYIRLKNLTVGYTFPTSWTNKINLQSVRLYGSAQNFITWTKYTGYDPEASSSGQIPLNRGIDNGVYPNYKTLLIGLGITL